MNSMRWIAVALVLAAFAAAAEDRRAAETRTIEALISVVEKLPDAKFVRNGKAYDAAAAAKFLRGKWSRQAGEIDTADEFIEKIATRSSTTGRVYLVRFNDGREMPVAAFLRAELRKLR